MTVKQLEALRAEEKPYKRTVDTGLMVRVSTSGVKTWIVQYMVGGKQRDFALARPWGPNSNESHLSLADARAEAERIRSLARQGIDYKNQQEQARSAEAQRLVDEAREAALRADQNRSDSLSVQDLFGSWLRDGVRRKDGNHELRRSFTADVLPAVGKIAVKDLTEHDLRAVLRGMVERGVNRSSVVMRNNLTQMFAWAMKRQPWRKLLANGDPMDLIEIERIVDPKYDLDNQRDRVLSPEEIRELHCIFQRVRTDHVLAVNKRYGVRPINAITELAVWIMLSTLCRVGELSMAKWDHIDFDAALWHIPKENVKNNVADLDVFLSPFALAKFRHLHQLTGGKAWCFPGRDGASHLDVKSISKQVGDRQARFKKSKDGSSRKPMKNRQHSDLLVLAGGGNGAWSPHDLRRTGATMMQGLGISLDIIDRCQNHVLAGSKVRRHYLRHDYADEKRGAWHKLGESLHGILSK